MPVPHRTPLLTLMRLENQHAASLKRILSVSAKQIDADLAKLPQDKALTRMQLEAQRASVQAYLKQDFGSIEKVVAQGQIDAAKAASKVAGMYERELLEKVMSKDVANRLLASEGQRAANGVEAALRRLEGSSYIPLSKQVYKTERLAAGWVDDKINQALVSGWDAKRLAKEIRGSIDPNVRGGVSYAADRLARSEINNAFHASALKRYEESGLVDGVDWNLSSSHPEGDICDQLAQESPYAPKNVPQKPHPFCYCFLTPHLPDEDEFLDNLFNGKYDDEPWAEKVDADKVADLVPPLDMNKLNKMDAKQIQAEYDRVNKLVIAQRDRFDDFSLMTQDPLYKAFNEQRIQVRNVMNRILTEANAAKRAAAAARKAARAAEPAGANSPLTRKARKIAVSQDMQKTYGKALTIHTDDAITKAWIGDLQKGFNETQHKVLAAYLRDKPGGGIFVGGRGSRVPDLDDMGHLRDVQPRGYAKGKTWADSGGAFSPNNRRVLVGDPAASGSASTMLHEGSHALDRAYQDIIGTAKARAVQITDRPEFRKAVDDFQKKDGVTFRAYYSHDGNPTGYRSEIWAEGGASISKARMLGKDPVLAVQNGLGIRHTNTAKAREAAEWFVRYWDDIEAQVAAALG